MVQLLLILFALYRWVRKDRVTFYLIIQFLVFKCYHLLPLGSIRGDDLALLGIIITSIISIFNNHVIDKKLVRHTQCFIGIILIISLISLTYYQLPFNQVISGCRHYLFILCLFDISRMTHTELTIFLKKLFYLNLIACALFIIYTFTHIPIYHTEYSNSSVIKLGFLGLKRVYTFPQLISFTCLYSLFIKGFKDINGKLSMLVALGCLLCIQSRGMILNVTLVASLGYMITNNKSSSKVIGLIFIILAAYFINETIFSGETGTKTANDLSQIFSGDVFRTGYEVEGDATFTYRIALLMSTIHHMIEVSIISLLFGFGFFIEISKSMVINLGILNLARESWNGYGLFTPDISYVNILCNLGLIGAFFYIRFFQLIAKKSYAKIKDIPVNKYALISFLYILYLLLIGLDGSTITYPSCLLIPFMIMFCSNTYSLKK